MSNRKQQSPQEAADSGDKRPWSLFPEQLAFICFTVFISGVFLGWNMRARQSAPPAEEHQHADDVPATSGDDETGPAPSLTLDQAREQMKQFDDVETLVQLGNQHYDMNQPTIAIAAYERALELKPDIANVWSDLGTMYRSAKQPRKAIECYERALHYDPEHVNSLYNMGVVYRHDLRDDEKAAEVWRRYLELAPDADSADEVRKALAELKKGAPPTESEPASNQAPDHEDDGS